MTTVCKALDAELRLGRYQDVLLNTGRVDTLIMDAPYASKVHAGHNAATAEDGADRRKITYDPWTPLDVRECVEFWRKRVAGWWVTITDHELASAWEWELEVAGLTVFAPQPFVSPGSSVRFCAGGPNSITCWIVAARPKSLSSWRLLPGEYRLPPGKKAMAGGKPLALMEALVRDYSNPGDLVCDPTAGAGTTLRAAQTLWRRGIGAEMDPRAYALGAELISRPFTRPWRPDAPEGQQTDLFPPADDEAA